MPDTVPSAVPVLTFAHPKNLSAKEETSIFANGEAEAQREKVICILSLRCAGFVRPQSPWIDLFNFLNDKMGRLMTLALITSHMVEIIK